MAASDAAHQGQAQPYTACFLASAWQTIEGLKNALAISRWHTWPAVTDLQTQGALLPIDGQGDRLAAMPNCVFQQVAQ
jgi:hypothetical protein